MQNQRRTKKVIPRIPRRNRKVGWSTVREELRPRFAKAGINSCEVMWEGCEGSSFLTFAHSLRRVVIDEYVGAEHLEKMQEVIRACTPCHQQLDARKRHETYEIVKFIISQRETPVEKYGL